VSPIDLDAAAKAIAHPLRATILDKLEGSSRSASELAKEVNQPIPNVTYHLMLLYDLGAIRVTERRRGRGAIERFYTASWRVRLVAEEIEN
jgi:DNA-binding transcriptional ArsR family regulator